mmetsp:Transcript_126063/g.368405  ORF Transcript_126063/g.368405 Transcript_126063/m.368405 type:complete len:228 (-) Transcript_126063:719-1402(-)
MRRQAPLALAGLHPPAGGRDPAVLRGPAGDPCPEVDVRQVAGDEGEAVPDVGVHRLPHVDLRRVVGSDAPHGRVEEHVRSHADNPLEGSAPLLLQEPNLLHAQLQPAPLGVAVPLRLGPGGVALPVRGVALRPDGDGHEHVGLDGREGLLQVCQLDTVLGPRLHDLHDHDVLALREVQRLDQPCPYRSVHLRPHEGARHAHDAEGAAHRLPGPPSRTLLHGPRVGIP